VSTQGPCNRGVFNSVQGASARLSQGHGMELSKKVKIALDETRTRSLARKSCSGSSFVAPLVTASISFRRMCVTWKGSRSGSWSALSAY
jgi:hypothetical protein